jgi:divalent metal cation (Fe/Co/Zn/Cd) transporter
MISRWKAAALDWVEHFPLSARDHAVLGSYLSLALGLFEFVVNWSVARTESSDSLMGVVLLSFMEMATSLMVLYRWKVLAHGNGEGEFNPNEKRAEVMGSMVIAVLMAFLGAGLIFQSVFDLMYRGEESRVALGVLASVITASLSLALAEYKIHFGKKLSSMILITDGKCTQCVALVSAFVIVGLILRQVMWWVDSTLGVFLATYIATEGFICYREAQIEWMRARLEGWASSGVLPTLEQRLLGPHGILST